MSFKNFSNLYEHHLQEMSDKVCVEDGNKSLTFGELEYISIQIANFLISNGFQKGDKVILSTKRQVYTIATIFGILKAGGVFVPVETEIPVERLKYIISEVKPAFITADLNTRLDLGFTNEISEDLVLQFAAEAQANKGELPVYMGQDIVIEEDDLCYIIFTSGSTGRPKGVPISHDNFMAFVESMELVYIMNKDSRCLATIPYHFDASMEDFYALYMGASIYITPSFTFPSLLVDIIEKKKITHIATTPSILNLIYENIRTKNKSVNFDELDTIIMGGEVCEKKVLNLLFDINSNIKVINGYGPTEATSDAVTYTIRNKSETSGYFPIGKALKNINTAILTPNGEVTEAIGAKGELLLSGRQVFKGYLNNEKETQNALITINGVTYYKTGDICEIDQNEDYLYLGRNNEELKLNGFRVNLNEIKSLVNTIEFINTSETFVLHTEERSFLSVALELNNEIPEKRIKELNDILRKYLPYYMIPSSYVRFNKLPLLPNSKTDKNRLKTIMEENKETLKSGYYNYADSLVEVN